MRRDIYGNDDGSDGKKDDDDDDPPHQGSPGGSMDIMTLVNDVLEESHKAARPPPGFELIKEVEEKLATAVILGQGSFGVVFQVFLNGRIVAVKKPRNDEGRVLISHEVKILRQLPEHPNLVSLVAAAGDLYY